MKAKRHIQIVARMTVLELYRRIGMLGSIRARKALDFVE